MTAPLLWLLVAGAVLASLAMARRKPSYVHLTDRFLVRASVAGRTVDEKRPVLERLRHFLLRRQVLALFHPAWAPAVHVTMVRISPADTRVPSACEEYELDFMRGGLWQPRFQYLRFQARVAAVAAWALVALSLVGRPSQDSVSSTPPAAQLPERDDSPLGRSFGPPLVGRWLQANVAQPSPHPFRKVSAPISVPQQVVSHTNSAGNPINNFQPHSNVVANTPHTNVAQVNHTNTFTAHTNTDVRPFPGPL